jgi:hypothetical protein
MHIAEVIVSTLADIQEGLQFQVTETLGTQHG